MVWVIFPFVLIAVALLLVVTAAALLAWGLTHPPRMGDGKALAILGRLSPADLGMEFLDVTFQVVDESCPRGRLKIAGWWIPAKQPGGRCVILLHGYADAKIGTVGWAPVFHSLGWNILAIDLRAHGESDGDFITAGRYERHDVSQVIDLLRLERPDATKTLVLFGVSMGSSIATHVAAMRDDLAGVILESFVGDFIYASQTHTHLLGLPGGAINRLSGWFARWLTGTDFFNDLALHALSKVKCPVLMILGTADPFVHQPDVLRTVRELPNIELWQPEGVDHVLAMESGYEEYVGRIEKFLISLQD